MQELFKKDSDLKDLLTNPIINEDKKKDIISKIADKAKFSEYFVNFLNILIDQDRLVSGEAIFDAFEKRYSELTDTQVRFRPRLFPSPFLTSITTATSAANS